MSDRVVRLARGHYENFPVLSRFVPPELRRPLASVYAFARVTDDIGDEGTTAPQARVTALDRWERQLDVALAGGRPKPRHPHPAGRLDPVLADVARTIRAFDLPIDAFRALIQANRMDQLRSRYDTYAELLDYCRHSANPVGRIVLRLFGRSDAALLPASDAICTALQVANHWQGIAEDLRLRDRLYVPAEDLLRFGVTEEDLRRERPNRRVRSLVGFLVDRTRHLLEEGAWLPGEFDGGRAAVLRLFVRGGRAILDRIEECEADLLSGGIRVRRLRALSIVASEGLRSHRGRW